MGKKVSRQAGNLKTVIEAMEKIAPLKLAASWDNVGLIIEPPTGKELPELEPADAPASDTWRSQKVKNLFLTIDLTEKTLTEAMEYKSDMIIAYHPPIFEAYKKYTLDDSKQRIIMQAIRSGIAVYSPHTALDATQGGVNDWLAMAIGKGSTEAIESADQNTIGSQCKLVVYAQSEDMEDLRDALCNEAGCGWIGNYSHCSFNIQGYGTFKGNEYANPAVGKKNRVNYVDEIRMEMFCSRHRLAKAAEVIRRVHSYEEPAWEVYPLANTPQPEIGHGRYIYLDEAIGLEKLVKRVKSHLKLKRIRVAAADRHLEGEPIDFGAVCPGAGGSMFSKIHGPQVYLTGEMRHHDILQKNSEGSTVILTDHTNCERGFLPILKQKLDNLLGEKMSITISAADKDPLEVM